MVGKTGISVMASQMKNLSAIQYSTNSALREVSNLFDKQKAYEGKLENYNYHLNAIHSVDDLYIGPHKKEQLETAIQILRQRIEDIKHEINVKINNIGGPYITLPNVNYHIFSEKFENEDSPIVTLHYNYDTDKFEADKRLSHAKIASSFDVDSADFYSQLLSSATDNAKELDLGKLNATPAVMTIYPSRALLSKSFEESVDNMVSPLTDMLIRNASSNIYDKNTTENRISDLLNKVEQAMYDGKSEALLRLKPIAINALETNYKLRLNRGFITDLNTGNIYDIEEINRFKELFFKPAQTATLLAGYLSINQGIKTNSWDLYNFANRLQDKINGMYITNKYQPTFNFKDFLDSLANNGSYHQNHINQTSPLFRALGLNFNPLNILATNEHYAKQLSAFNSANTILRESSYRIDSMYHFVDKLRDMGYIGPTSNIKEQDFNEVEKFVEANIIHTFLKSEDNNSSNNDEKPIFYIKGRDVTLTTKEGRKEFINWMQTDFLRNIQENSILKGNPFTQDLRLDNKQDSLLFNKVDFMKLQMDTTNVKTNVEQGPFRDAYVSGLKEVYDNKYTDLNGNNIFNALFWYNLILNKNNITKNSYAKLLGDVMWADNKDPNVYSRLFELKGKIGKSSDVELNLGTPQKFFVNEADTVGTESENFYKLSIAGIPFDLRNLAYYFEVGTTHRLPLARRDDFDDFYNEQPEDYSNEETGNVDGGVNLDNHSYDYNDNNGDDNNDDNTEEAAKIPRNYMYIDRWKQLEVPGTRVVIRVNGQSQEENINESTTTMPLKDGNFELSNSLNYNPFVKKSVELRPDQNEAFNYWKLATDNIHNFLSRLSDTTDIQITHNGVTEKFDKDKNYDC